MLLASAFSSGVITLELSDATLSFGIVKVVSISIGLSSVIVLSLATTGETRTLLSLSPELFSVTGCSEVSSVTSVDATLPFCVLEI